MGHRTCKVIFDGVFVSVRGADCALLGWKWYWADGRHAGRSGRLSLMLRAC